MPSALMTLDTGRPTFSGKETTEQKVDALNNYVFMLLENLRYLLRNLGPENMNEAEMRQWVVNNILGGEKLPDNIFVDSIYTDELYANYGEIADLMVNRLRTDYARAQNYLHGITSDINYIYIHDEAIEYWTAEVSSTVPVHLKRFNEYPMYWTDNTRSTMTRKETGLPVLAYQYKELCKARINFQRQTENGSPIWYPVFQFGAGNDLGRNVGKVVKDAEGFRVQLSDVDGNQIGLHAHYQGGVEAPGLLWFGTKAEYDAIGRKNKYTTYFIEETP